VAGPNASHHGYQKSLCHILLAPVGIGTAINVLAVLAGARLPEGMRSTAMQAIGIVTLLVGVSHFLKVDNVLVPLLSVILGLVGFLDAVITGPMISSTTATGGVLIFGLGLGLLDLKEVRVANMLPALLFAPLLVAASPLWPL
jgi:uncharacterized membrane protein YqgA involved in biofilm formation